MEEDLYITTENTEVCRNCYRGDALMDIEKLCEK